MSKTILLFLCLFPALARPQAPASEAGKITKVVRVHTTATNLAAVASAGSPVDIRADNTLKAIVIKGKPSDVEALEKTIRELDSPTSTSGSKNVELTVYLLSGSNSSSSPAAESTAAAVTPVVKQLRAVFPYSNYLLLSTILLRSAADAPASTAGLLKAFGNAAEGSSPTSYTILYKAARVSSDQAGPNIHLTGFHFLVRVPIAHSMFDAGIDTDIDLREGQKVVVGKSNLENVDSALFVILVAKLVQ
jgi:type II secretory pathway component GspD/PulD (secretin)